MVLCSVHISSRSIIMRVTNANGGNLHLRFNATKPFCSNATDASSAASFRHATRLHHYDRHSTLLPIRPGRTSTSIVRRTSCVYTTRRKATSSLLGMHPCNGDWSATLQQRTRGGRRGKGRPSRGGRIRAAAGRGRERDGGRGGKQESDGTGRDYYQTLGLSRDATKEQIKTKFRQLARKHHPDVTGNTASNQSFLAILKAYDVLSDEAERTAYDLTLPTLRPNAFSSRHSNQGRSGPATKWKDQQQWQQQQKQHKGHSAGWGGYRASSSATPNAGQGSGSSRSEGWGDFSKEHTGGMSGSSFASGVHFRKPMDSTAKQRFSKYAAWAEARHRKDRDGNQHRYQQQQQQQQKQQKGNNSRSGHGQSRSSPHAHHGQSSRSNRGQESRSGAGYENGSYEDWQGVREVFHEDSRMHSSESAWGYERSFGTEWSRESRTGEFSSRGVQGSSGEHRSEPLFSLAKVLPLWGAAIFNACIPPLWKQRRRPGGDKRGGASEMTSGGSSGRYAQGREWRSPYPPHFAYEASVAEASNLGGQSYHDYDLDLMQQAVSPIVVSLLLVGSVCIAFPPTVALAALSITLITPQDTPLGFRLASIAACVAGGANGLMIVAALNILARLPGCGDVQLPAGVLGFALLLGPWLQTTLGVYALAPVVVALQTASFVLEA